MQQVFLNYQTTKDVEKTMFATLAYISTNCLLKIRLTKYLF